jgi:hypothetical protein
VLWVRLAEVVEDGLEGQIEAGGEEARTDNGDDPVDAITLFSAFFSVVLGKNIGCVPFARCPGKGEEADGDADGTDLAGPEAVFRLYNGLRVGDSGLVDEVEPEKVC